MFLRNALAALAVLCLCACGGSSGDSGDDTTVKTGVFSLFDPTAASPTIPFPFDALFAGATGPTLNIPNSSNASFVTAANLQDGFSTTASIFTDLLGDLDYSTLKSGLLVINAATGAVLTPGIDYTTQPSVALDTNPLSGELEPISSFRSRVLIEPLKPLAPATRYIVVLTTQLKSLDGLTADPAELFKVVRSGTPVADQTVPILQTETAEQKAELESIRSTLIRPIVTQLAAFGLAETDIVLTWSFTTQSITNTLDFLQSQVTAGTPATLAAQNTGATLAAFNAELPPIANVYEGTITLPYYLSPPTESNPTAPLTAYWLADASQPDTGKTFLGNPCAAFTPAAGLGLSPSVSTTACFPVPVKQIDQTVPVLITLPNANSGRTMPANGWPVVIFQHGITGNRSNMLALSPALTLAGFAVVAIDLPLHGITPQDPAAALRIAGVTERTFDLDLENNTTGAPGPDGVVDPSGTYFINLSSLATSRDNLREAVSDLMVLTRATPGAVLLTSGSPDGNKFDGTQIRFVGHSLGGIVGGTFLGEDTSTGAGTLAMPGGGIAKLLDASVEFGPIISAGLAASGVNEGTDVYETFMRFAQTLVDSGDPINYATAAIANHPIHMIEVIGSATSPADQVVPNSAPANPGTTNNDKVTITGFLSGTDPLYQQMGLTPTVFTGSADVLLGAPAHGNVVQYTTGTHSSILDPTSSPTATAEMQKDTASFAASNGLCLPIGGACP